MTVRQRESAKTNSPNSKEKPKENGNEKPAGMYVKPFLVYLHFIYIIPGSQSLMTSKIPFSWQNIFFQTLLELEMVMFSEI